MKGAACMITLCIYHRSRHLLTYFWSQKDVLYLWHKDHVQVSDLLQSPLHCAYKSHLPILKTCTRIVQSVAKHVGLALKLFNHCRINTLLSFTSAYFSLFLPRGPVSPYTFFWLQTVHHESFVTDTGSAILTIVCEYVLHKPNKPRYLWKQAKADWGPLPVTFVSQTSQGMHTYIILDFQALWWPPCCWRLVRGRCEPFQMMLSQERCSVLRSD